MELSPYKWRLAPLHDRFCLLNDTFWGTPTTDGESRWDCYYLQPDGSITTKPHYFQRKDEAKEVLYRHLEKINHVPKVRKMTDELREEDWRICPCGLEYYVANYTYWRNKVGEWRVYYLHKEGVLKDYVCCYESKETAQAVLDDYLRANKVANWKVTAVNGAFYKILGTCQGSLYCLAKDGTRRKTPETTDGFTTKEEAQEFLDMYLAMEKIEVRKGDITKVIVDAIVNAANPTLLGGGGVDGAIHHAAGPQLREECRTLGGCETGKVKVTKGYNLSAEWVIHTVGPIWRGGQNKESELLASCYEEALKLAVELGAKTIAFPSISTGAYMFPLMRAADIAHKTVSRFLAKDKTIDKVIFVCFDQDDYDYQSRMRS